MAPATDKPSNARVRRTDSTDADEVVDRRIRGRFIDAADADRAGAPDKAAIGRFAHNVIGELLEAGEMAPDSKTIGFAVMRQPLDTIRSARPHAAAQQLSVGVALYFRLFIDDGWVYAGREVSAHGVRFDIVFESVKGLVRTDQLKTGRLDLRLEIDRFEDQISREFAAGQKKWGAKHAGLRALILGAPRKSFEINADGERKPLTWEGVR